MTADRLSRIASRLCRRRVTVRLNLTRRECGGAVAALAFLADGSVEIRLTPGDAESTMTRFLHELIHLRLGPGHWAKSEAERERECEQAVEALERRLAGTISERLDTLDAISRM